MNVSLLSIATASPRYSIDQEEYTEVGRTFFEAPPEQARLFPALVRRTRVQSRGSVVLEHPPEVQPRQEFFAPLAIAGAGGPSTAARLQKYEQEANRLAVQAAEQAFSQTDLSPQAITHLITVTCTGFAAPGFDFALMEHLQLPPQVARTQIGFMGCHGAINGLRVAQAYVNADPNAKVLVCATELCSLHFQYGWDPEKIVANALFADGAAATLVTAETSSPWKLKATGSCLFPNSADAMTWKIGNHGFEMTLSAKVPSLIQSHLHDWLSGWLQAQGVTFADIAHWAIHPGGPRVVSSVAESLELPETATAASLEVLANHGNMSSPTILFILNELQQQNCRGLCLALGFGPGLVAEAMLLEAS